MANPAIAMKNDGFKPLMLLAVLGATFLYAFFPALSDLVQAWAASDDNSHGFAIVPIALYFLWQKRKELAGLEVNGAGLGLLPVVLALAFYIVAKKGEMQTFAYLSMILFIWGSTVYLFGYRIFAACLFPLAMLLFMVPVPAQIIAALTIPLQLVVSKFSVAFASLAGVPIYREGNVINLPEGSFEVVQACSGLRSIMALLMMGAVVSYLTLRSKLLRGVLFLFAVPIALVVNMMRVFVLVTVFHYGHLDLSRGTPHTLLGLAVFVVAIGLFIICSKGLSLCER